MFYKGLWSGFTSNPLLSLEHKLTVVQSNEIDIEGEIQYNEQALFNSFESFSGNMSLLNSISLDILLKLLNKRITENYAKEMPLQSTTELNIILKERLALSKSLDRINTEIGIRQKTLFTTSRSFNFVVVDTPESAIINKTGQKLFDLYFIC